MAATATTPVRARLYEQPLSAKVDLTQTKDADGFYFRAGDLVEIAADEKVRKATEAGKAFGILETSIHETGAPDGLDARHRVGVLTRYKAVVEAVAEGAIAAGEFAVLSTTGAGKVKKASGLAATVDAGATAVTSTAANGAITTVSGSVPPEIIFGQCWKGGADAAKVLVLV